MICINLKQKMGKKDETEKGYCTLDFHEKLRMQERNVGFRIGLLRQYIIQPVSTYSCIIHAPMIV